MQVVLGMAADKITIPGEGYVAFDDSRAHPRAGLVGLLRMLGELERTPAVTDREIGAAERAVPALHQLVLQRPFVHSLHEVERTWSELDRFVVPVVAIGRGGERKAHEHGERSRERGRKQDVAHGYLPGFVDAGAGLRSP